MLNYRNLLLLFPVLCFLCSYTYPQKLYFCEEYKDGKEIAVSDVFTVKSNGRYFTCMLDLRGTGLKVETAKIVLRIVKYENGSQKFVADEKFDVQANWDYIYFDKFHTFYEVGRYKITALKHDDTPIASGEVTIGLSTSDVDSTTESSSRLYFCEKYVNEEIGVSDIFYISAVGGGTFTAMLDIRGSGTTVNTEKVKLKIYKLNGSEEKFVSDENFDVNPNWDYIYFSDFHDFSSAGVYRVRVEKPDGTAIAIGNVSVRVR